MLVNYTILYLILLYLGPLLEAISPIILIFAALLREGYLIFVFILCLFKITSTCKIKNSIENNLLELCILMALPYIVFTNNIGKAVPTFLAFFSGPFIFCCITNCRLSVKTKRKLDCCQFLMLSTICFLSILLYFFQDKVVNYFPPEIFSHFYLTEVNGDGFGRLRLFGIGFHPTTTGFLFVYYIAMLIFRNRNYVLSAVNAIFWYFTNARSALFGIPAYIFVKTKKLFQILIVVFGIFFLVSIFRMFSDGSLHKVLDASALVHILHLFITGPAEMISHLTGSGLGSVSPYNTENPIIHLESDLYLYSIQLNILNLLFYIIVIFHIVFKLKRKNTRQSNFLLFIVLTFYMGCIVFPLHSLRFTSNFVWIELAFYFAKPYEEENDVFSHSRNLQWLKFHN